MKTNSLQTEIATHGDFHLFEFKGRFYLYDIERMNVFEVNHETYTDLFSRSKEELRTMIEKTNIKAGSKQKDIPGAEPQPLVNISINVAQTCNLSCVYCYAVDGEYGAKGLMPDEIAFKSVDYLIKESRNEKNISITFFGGEPLLNFQLIKKVVTYSRAEAKKANKSITFSMTTNGTLFTPEINQYLNENNFGIVVSFDGDEEAQNKNRPFTGGGGSYSYIKPRVQEFLASRKGNATARATITNHTTDLRRIKSQLLEIGFKKANATIATLSEFAVTNREVDIVDEEKLRNVCENSEKESEEIMQSIKIKKLPAHLQNTAIIRYLNQLKSKYKNFYSCGAGRRMAGISIKGDIYPCHRFVGDENFNMGNIAASNTENRREYSKSFARTDLVCNQCWAKYHCGGKGCMQDNLIMEGDIYNINTTQCARLVNDLKLAIDIYTNLDFEDRKFVFATK